MKTIEAFYKEIADSKELQEELGAVTDETLAAFLAKHGCNATAEEFVAFAKAKAEGELDDDGAEQVNGGIYYLSIKPDPRDPMP